ncbi:MAG: PQQ-binding-like beta-propeller repeat protein, partial [Ignavibacteriaceae bacterium]|nr:PQQ-binding-like beta-propeller repeat protein [Ignavibacteriaceae bacterium]
MLKFSLIALLLFLGSVSLAQINYTALITEPQIGSQENANNLIQAVDDINKRENVSYVIVLGNITADGKLDDFIWAQEILDGLNVPYSIVGGEKDYYLSEGKGSEISLLWGEDKNIFYDKNFNLICFNTIIPEYSKENHIGAETLEWLKDALTKLNSKKIITFSYHPIKKADNSSTFYKTIIGHKLFSFVSKANKQKKEISTLEGFYLNRKNDWGYLLITTKKDSVIIKKILGEEVQKKIKPEIVYSVFAPITLFKSIEPVKNFLSVGILWSENFQKTIITSVAFKDDKIFAGFKDGTIICLFSTGKEKWRYNSHGKIKNSPIASKDLLITETADGDILTLNVNTGPPAKVIGIGENLAGITVVDLEENSKGIVTGTNNGNLYCYNLETLEPVWTNQITNESINSPLVYSKNKIFFQDKGGILYCLSSNNGLLIWKISPAQGGWKIQDGNSGTNFNNNLAVHNTNLYLTDEVGSLYCIDALLGTNNWNIKNISANGLIRFNKKSELVLPTIKNKIITVSPKLGKVINEIQLPPDTKSA